MRFLVASDLHGSLPSAQRVAALAKLHQPGLIILLGDLLYHGPRNPLPEGYAPREAAAVLNQLGPRVLAIRGNCDALVDTVVLTFPLVDSAWVFADGLRIWLAHGHDHLLPDRLPDLAPGDVFLCGHTHIPRGETVGNLHVWNPGSITLPKRGEPAAYGLIEDGVFRVFTLDGHEHLNHMPLPGGH